MDVREEFRAAYASAFHDYVTAAAGEQGLERAYELGRTAVSEGLGVLDLAAIHHESLAEALALASSAEEHARAATAATEFAMESLSTFEMAQRGFREAQEAARLEKEHSGQPAAWRTRRLRSRRRARVEELAELVSLNALEIIGAGRAVASLDSGGQRGVVNNTIAVPDQQDPARAAAWNAASPPIGSAKAASSCA